MSSVLDMLIGQLGGDTTRQISRQLGADEGATGKAVAAALPLLMGALARNASKADGAQALAGALQRDHDGSILDDVAGFLGRAESGPGDGILRHVLGGKRDAVQNELGREAGLDTASTAKLMTMLAPLVMGALGKTQRQQNLDSAGLATMLAGERQQAEATRSLGPLASLLDADKDGDISDDVMKVGKSLLGRFLRGNR